MIRSASILPSVSCLLHCMKDRDGGEGGEGCKPENLRLKLILAFAHCSIELQEVAFCID